MKEGSREGENSARVIPMSPGSWPALLQPLGPKALPPVGWILLVIWTLVWKGLALWRAARAGQVGWFLAFLVIHTLGLLEMVYLLFFVRRPVAGTAVAPATPWAPVSVTAASGGDPHLAPGEERGSSARP